MFAYLPWNASNQVWYSGAGNVAPAPWRVRLAVAGAGAVIADAPPLAEAPLDAATLGVVTLGAAELGDVVAPPLQAVAPTAASNPSATRRLVTGLITGNASSNDEYSGAR